MDINFILNIKTVTSLFSSPNMNEDKITSDNLFDLLNILLNPKFSNTLKAKHIYEKIGCQNFDHFIIQNIITHIQNCSFDRLKMSRKNSCHQAHTDEEN